MIAKLPKRQADRLQLRVVQAIFVFVNLVLIETHLPGMLWVAIGGVFWVTMILLAAIGGSWMCGWVCWVGSIQDFMEPFASSRIQLNSRWGRNITLAVLIGWVPLIWWLIPEATTASYTPFGINLDAWTRHLFQVGLMILVALSVMVLGKRGICRYLCPFNSIVRAVRQRLPHAFLAPPKDKSKSQTGCAQCAITCQTSASIQTEPRPTPISLVFNDVKHDQNI